MKTNKTTQNQNAQRDQDKKKPIVGTGSGQTGGAGGVKRSSGPQDTPDQK